MVNTRAATPRDAEVIISLLEELAVYEELDHVFAPSVRSLSLDLHRNANARLHAQLAFKDKEAVGVSLYYIGAYRSFRTQWRVYLEDVFVRAEHRGSGILTQLLQPVATTALRTNAQEIALSVLEWNSPAIRVYERLGAEHTGSRFERDGTQWLTMVIRGEALQGLTAPKRRHRTPR